MPFISSSSFMSVPVKPAPSLKRPHLQFNGQHAKPASSAPKAKAALVAGALLAGSGLFLLSSPSPKDVAETCQSNTRREADKLDLSPTVGKEPASDVQAKLRILAEHSKCLARLLPNTQDIQAITDTIATQLKPGDIHWIQSMYQDLTADEATSWKSALVAIDWLSDFSYERGQASVGEEVLQLDPQAQAQIRKFIKEVRPVILEAKHHDEAWQLALNIALLAAIFILSASGLTLGAYMQHQRDETPLGPKNENRPLGLDSFTWQIETPSLKPNKADRFTGLSADPETA
jgi:hypothetical protein